MNAADDIVALAANYGLQLVPRSGHEDVWSDVWLGLGHHPIDHAPYSLDYNTKYFRDAGWKLEDASVIFFDGDRPCGIWPLHVGGPEGMNALYMAGTSVQLPLFAKNLPSKTMRRMLDAALNALRDWAAELNINSLHIRHNAMPTIVPTRINFADRQLLSMGAKTQLHHELHVDLNPTMDQIRLNFRKSYRPLINLGLRTWSSFIMDHNCSDPDTWEEFRRLHFESAGKRWTRGKATWDTQYRMVTANNGFLVGLRDVNTGRLNGAGFFQTTRDEGVYAVAAYNRAEFNKPLGHVVQYLAIERMKEMGLSNYRLGVRHYPGDIPEPSPKELDISYFKEGFASGIYRAVTYILPTRN